ncbi:MAG: hypothetical protein ACK559_30000, partial [bacterium]
IIYVDICPQSLAYTLCFPLAFSFHANTDFGSANSVEGALGKTIEYSKLTCVQLSEKDRLGMN